MCIKFKTILFEYLFRFGIDVEGFSGDGDARILSTMLRCTELNCHPAQMKQQKFGNLEDTVHVGTKLRNRLLVASIHLPLGHTVISLSHLQLLINNVSKEIHGLVMKDICPDDRQNYGSLEKMMKTRVINSLQETVIGSEGTVMFLRICEEVTSSLTKVDLSPLERLYKLWHATFILRAWRKWMKETKFKLKENFISLNAYTCIEVNAVNLILITQKFREEGMEQFFMPTLFNSQPCEEIFRAVSFHGNHELYKDKLYSP